ncbi:MULTISPECIES: hypothetical protein [unclassified Sedimentibacter]|uniref:hypothetical protein n=1 Tax=unclassified Sedimentibacter TaxID=2649220 RepID=UPI0027DF0B40|nr:hypothetical protein [Sedimentibacter sp. MB35-C1]WMJ77300.1 hypothetical protein RBQ61_17305 [Sedimentibacter sp. MB35-C1]
MKNKKWIFAISMILVLTIYVVMSRPQDAVTSMEKLISKNINTNQSITIYNSIVIDNHRLVSYILSSKDEYQGVGYAHFKVNNKGKYELLNVIEPDKITEKASNITIYEFNKVREEISELITNEVSINKSLFIISNNPNLSRIERIMDNGEIKSKEINVNPSISFFDDLDGNNKAEYNFYNESGDIIE